MSASQSETIPLIRGLIQRPTTINLSRVVTWHTQRADAIQKHDAIERIIQTVCDTFKIDRGHILTRDRHEYVTWPRQVAMALAYELSGRSAMAIGHYFGGRDHGTVLHAIKAVEGRCATNLAQAYVISKLRQRLSE